MEGKEFVAKFKEILKKAGDAAERYLGYLVVSDDPDCDVDYGLDEQGYLVLDCKKSMFKVKDLEKIRYRALKESDDIGECYISLLFKNDRALYMYFGDEAMLGECIELYYNGRLVSEQIVFAVNYGWNGEDDLVITDDGSLVGYLGEEKNVILPENVVMIKKSAFENSKIETIVLADATKTIESRAFLGTRNLKTIDLKNVELIEDDAFRASGLEQITLPKTLRTIGNEVFYYSGIKSLDHVCNESSLEISADMFKSH